MELLILTYFHTILGPKITHVLRLDESTKPFKLPVDLEEQVKLLFDSKIDEGFFSFGFKKYLTANYYFQIPSDWARGNQEMLSLSILTDTKKPGMYKTPLKEGAARFKATPDIYKGFYAKRRDEVEEIKKNQEEIKNILIKICQDAILIEKIEIVDQKRHIKARNNKRDKARDLERDEKRDRDRDKARDMEWDKARDRD